MALRNRMAGWSRINSLPGRNHYTRPYCLERPLVCFRKMARNALGHRNYRILNYFQYCPCQKVTHDRGYSSDYSYHGTFRRYNTYVGPGATRKPTDCSVRVHQQRGLANNWFVGDGWTTHTNGFFARFRLRCTHVSVYLFLSKAIGKLTIAYYSRRSKGCRRNLAKSHDVVRVD